MNLVSRGWVCLLAVLAASAATAAVEIDSSTFGGMRARALGPAAMGGRISAMDVVRHDGRLHVWVGAAGGGVWKSVNGATTFSPVFDDHTQAIGAVTIDPSDADTVWVGTGEGWTRNSVSVGTGVYKTTDGGDNWTQVGLEDSERIVEILVHPEDGDTVWACVTGHLWDSHETRGIYRTTDGGGSWERVLYVDADTGCSDIAMDPQEPDILYGAMWEFRRYPWFFESGGPGSGLYKSTDGGKTWRELERGLPAGELGRIAVAVAPSRPSVVYATVESEKTALYRSEDLGETWTRVGTTSAVEARPFYFSLLHVDPEDYRRVYKPASQLAVSDDGGKTWDGLGGGAHADHHALWIDSEDPSHLMLGTDGGLYVSYDRGVNWNFKQSLPISQFYHVSYDMERPYNVYGGLQDNGTWYGPSATPAGVQNKHWRNLGPGDGFRAHVDREDPDIVYVEWQGGRVLRVRKSTGETKEIAPYPDVNGPELRYNWNTALETSPTSSTLYVGAQFLYRSKNRGDTWERISPDLTTDDPAKQRQIESGGLTPDNSTAENHCTIYAIAESPLDPQVIWAGTDDGNLQLTRDGGETWTNVVENVTALPANTWVTDIEAGRHAAGTAYVTFDGHRTGDMATHVYRTTDFGATWQALATDAVEGYALSVLEDSVNPGLVFLGTEFGLYVTVDGGESWARFKENLPKVGVRALALHPREHDLILGTHGRGIYVIDDITPLRHLTAETLESGVTLLPNRSSTMVIPASVQEFPGDDEFVGANPPGGAAVTYYLRKRHLFGDLRVEIYDADGELLATVPGSKRRGINRVHWSMRMRPPKVPPAASLVPQLFSFLGPRVPEGEYDIRLVKGKQTIDGTIAIAADPRADYTAEDKALQDRTVLDLYRQVERLTFLVDRVNDLRDQAAARAERLKQKDKLRGRLDDFSDELEAFRKTLVATRKGGFLAGEEQLREKLTALYGGVNGYEGRPSDSQIRYAEALTGRVAAAETRLDGILAASLEGLNVQLSRKQLEVVAPMTREAWEKDQER